MRRNAPSEKFMNRGLQTLVFVPILGLLAGCAQYQWRKQGSTREQFNQESYECQMQAAAAFPAAIVSQQMTSGYQTPAVTNCTSSGSAYGSYGNVYGNSNTNCTTTPGQTVRPVVYTSDANQENRAQASKACLYARGYELVRVDQQSRSDDCRANERVLVAGRFVCP